MQFKVILNIEIYREKNLDITCVRLVVAVFFSFLISIFGIRIVLFLGKKNI